MNFEEAQAAIGQTVEVSDGTPRPPERFNKKSLAKWKQTNYTGRLNEVKEFNVYKGYYGIICTIEATHITLDMLTDIKNIKSTITS